MKLLSLDISTSCSGWSLFDIATGTLIEHGILEPQMPKGYSKMVYPEKALHATMSMSQQLHDLVLSKLPQEIVIEEVNRGISRIGQKSLDAIHFMFLEKLFRTEPSYIKLTHYLDSNGTDGWRPTLGIRLSILDKEANKAIKIRIKKFKSKESVVNWKTLSVRWVMANYHLPLKTDNDPGTDGDIADSIALGAAWLKVRKP